MDRACPREGTNEGETMLEGGVWVRHPNLKRDETQTGKFMTADVGLSLSLMDKVLAKENLRRAFNQVVRNKGAPGIDGMPVGHLENHLRNHWPMLRC